MAKSKVSDEAINVAEMLCPLSKDKPIAQAWINDAAEMIQSAIYLVSQREYGRGVSAGKQEALKYTPEERERYGRWVAQAEEFAMTSKLSG